MKLLITDFRWMNCWKGLFKKSELTGFPSYRGEFWITLFYMEFDYTHPDNADGEESYSCRFEVGLLGFGIDVDICIITKRGAKEDWSSYHD